MMVLPMMGNQWKTRGLVRILEQNLVQDVKDDRDDEEARHCDGNLRS